MLLAIKGLSEAKVSKMVEACKQMTPGARWRCATEVAEEVSRVRCYLRSSSGAWCAAHLVARQ